MLYDALKTVHILSIVLWVGGMMFTHFFLRPAVLRLEGPQRLALMHDVLSRFFNGVLVASLLVFVTGYWMLGRVARQTVQAGAGFEMSLSWWFMTIAGTLMVAIFMHIRFALFRRMTDAVKFSMPEKAAAALASIRRWVLVNLALGVVIIAAVLLY